MTMPTPAEHQPTQPAAPTYVDPITGAALHIDPATGQLAYDQTQQPSTTPGAVAPSGAPTTPLAASGFPALTPMPAPGTFPTPGTFPMPGPSPTLSEPGYAPSGETPGASYPTSGHPAPGYNYPGYPAPGAYPDPNAYPSAMPGYAYPVSSYPYAPGARANSMSIAAMVVSIAAFPLLTCYGAGAILGLVGAILGHVARRQTRQRGEAGGGLALAGIICGWIAVGLGVILVGFFVWLFVTVDNASTIDDY